MLDKNSAQVFHYGSISLISEPSRSATLAAIESAREHGLLISYDPNLRLSLWPSPAEARRGIELGWGFADVIKISQEELEFLAGAKDLEREADEVFHPELKLLVVSRGREGCYFATGEGRGYVAGYRVAAVDTTGAGDGFVAGLLAGLLEIGFQLDPFEKLTDVLRLANAVGALTTTKRGAIPALPTRSAVEALMKGNTVARD